MRLFVIGSLYSLKWQSSVIRSVHSLLFSSTPTPSLPPCTSPLFTCPSTWSISLSALSLIPTRSRSCSLARGHHAKGSKYDHYSLRDNATNKVIKQVPSITPLTYRIHILISPSLHFCSARPNFLYDWWWWSVIFPNCLKIGRMT